MASGEETFYRHGRLHRDDGPAVTFLNHLNEKVEIYFINSKQLSKEEFEK
jgi:hypothetical protein